MSMPLFTDKIVSVSEFSQGRSGKIFNDVNTNKCDYIVMKNNTPIAVIVPMEEYSNYQKMVRSKLSGTRIGIAKGAFEVPEDFDDWDIGFGDGEDEDPT